MSPRGADEEICDVSDYIDAALEQVKQIEWWSQFWNSFIVRNDDLRYTLDIQITESSSGAFKINTSIDATEEIWDNSGRAFSPIEWKPRNGKRKKENTQTQKLSCCLAVMNRITP